ncbi:putative multi-domain containing protein [Aduncisulcus paluster]|uniref:GPN-loop GTPase 3 n=1 Tax=Aduncisulcus paluster TaxID=2918883 RepID=A0ABQ5KU60_9EUKA|nr:putative multi-domain containing protein [Aduncisulcus paluster]|eukprot:gnl/Carplike_NY0171/3036_a4082_551.p1 GENE.gnl/Carplike_NY0171/3036_a4082_551~~gnl/Carplike_NY0171/3036_a4082_551.p1  ORF type:complete len:320 (+),score=87.33 gnl/Carplike_NY0171/3036_a4082_551:55-1014(+)
MGKYAQLVVGPAGSGKTTYCRKMYEHLQSIKRKFVHMFNLDPAAEELGYEPSIDIRDLVMVDDVMEECSLGPNGALVEAVEYLIMSTDWLDEVLDDFSDDYLIIDCPGQVELYTHIPVMEKFCRILEQKGYRVVTVYLVDSSRAVARKLDFLASVLSVISTMVALSTPHVTVLSKCDLLPESMSTDDLDSFLFPDPSVLSAEAAMESPHLAPLSSAVSDVVTEFSLVGLFPLNWDDVDSINRVILSVDRCVDYGADEEMDAGFESLDRKEDMEADADFAGGSEWGGISWDGSLLDKGGDITQSSDHFGMEDEGSLDEMD